MSGCERERLYGYLDGEISEAEAREIEEHVGRCQECGAILKNAWQQKALLAGLPLAAPPARIRERARQAARGACQQVRPRLAAYLEGGLVCVEKEALALHLALCQGCREELRAYKKLRHLISGLPERSSPSRVRREVAEAMGQAGGRKEMPRRGLPSPVRLWPVFSGTGMRRVLGGAALAAAAVLLVWLYPSVLFKTVPFHRGVERSLSKQAAKGVEEGVLSPRARGRASGAVSSESRPAPPLDFAPLGPSPSGRGRGGASSASRGDAEPAEAPPAKPLPSPAAKASQTGEKAGREISAGGLFSSQRRRSNEGSRREGAERLAGEKNGSKAWQGEGKETTRALGIASRAGAEVTGRSSLRRETERLVAGVQPSAEKSPVGSPVGLASGRTELAPEIVEARMEILRASERYQVLTVENLLSRLPKAEEIMKKGGTAPAGSSPGPEALIGAGGIWS